MTSSCTTGTFGYPVPGSPLPPVSLGAATPAPSTTDQTPRRVATPTTFLGPADIEQMPASQAHDWRDIVSVWFKAKDVDRVLDLIADGELDADRVTITSTGIVLSGTPHPLLIEAGVIHEFYIDRFSQVLRFDDPAWGQIVPGSRRTEWQMAYWWGP